MFMSRFMLRMSLCENWIFSFSVGDTYNLRYFPLCCFNEIVLELSSSALLITTWTASTSPVESFLSKSIIFLHFDVCEQMCFLPFAISNRHKVQCLIMLFGICSVNCVGGLPIDPLNFKWFLSLATLHTIQSQSGEVLVNGRSCLDSWVWS